MQSLPMTSETAFSSHVAQEPLLTQGPRTTSRVFCVLSFVFFLTPSPIHITLHYTTQHNPPASFHRLANSLSLLDPCGTFVFRVVLRESSSWSSPFLIPSQPKPFVFPPSFLVFGFPWFCCVFPPLSPSVISGGVCICVCVIPWAERTKGHFSPSLLPTRSHALLPHENIQNTVVAFLPLCLLFETTKRKAKAATVTQSHRQQRPPSHTHRAQLSHNFQQKQTQTKRKNNSNKQETPASSYCSAHKREESKKKKN